MARCLGRGVVRRVVAIDGAVSYEGDWVDAARKRHRKTLGYDRATADRVLAKTIRDRDLEMAGMGTQVGLDMEVSTLVAQYLAELGARSKPRLVKETTAVLERMVVLMGLRLVRDITKPRVAGWRQTRLAAGASNKRVNNELVALRAAVNHAVSLGQLGIDPLRGLKALPTTAAHQRRGTRALADEEIVRMLGAAARSDAEQRGSIPREPLLRALVTTGCRWSELATARWGDLDRAVGVLLVRAEETKTQNSKALPLDVYTLEAVERARAAQTVHLGHEPRPDDWLFLTPTGAPWSRDPHNFRRWMYAVLRAAGIQRRDVNGRVVNVHALRKTFATRLARAGVSVATAKALTGHRSSQVLVDLYQQVGSEDAKAAILRLPSIPPSTSLANVGDALPQRSAQRVPTRPRR